MLKVVKIVFINFLFLTILGCKTPRLSLSITKTPVIKSVNVAYGYPGHTTEAIVFGDNFTKSTVVKFESEYIRVKTLTYLDNNQIKLNILILKRIPLDKKVSFFAVNKSKHSNKLEFNIVSLSRQATIKSKLLEERSLPKVEIDKSMYTLSCIKEQLGILLYSAGFDCKLPLYDDENRLQTYTKELRGKIVDNQNFYEKIGISVRISENNNAYRIFISAEGFFRRRKLDYDAEEKIKEEYIDNYLDCLLGKFKYAKCKDVSLKVILEWNTESDLDLSIYSDGEYSDYLNQHINSGILIEDSKNGLKGKEMFVFKSLHYTTFEVTVTFYKGSSLTRAKVSVIRGNKRYIFREFVLTEVNEQKKMTIKINTDKN